MLLIFSFGITPKKFLHDAIATHKDKVINCGDNSVQVSASGFTCKCDSLVAESPFTGEVIYFEFAAIPVFAKEQSILPYQFYSSQHFFFELRGPPFA